MINYIWGLFLIIGILYSFFNGTIIDINKQLIDSGATAIKMIINLIPLICLWLGVMQIAKDSGLLNKISKKIYPIIRIVFPDLEDNEAISLISSNIVMNILGLGNAATPFGLKAMKRLQEINTNKEEASRSMITFLVINTASITLIPTTVISLRVLHESKNPTEILLTAILTTIISCAIGLILDRIFYKIWRKKDG